MKSKSVEPILFKDDITIKVDLNGIGFALSARDYKGAQCVYIEKSLMQAEGMAIKVLENYVKQYKPPMAQGEGIPR